MPYILALIALIGGAYLWAQRLRGAAQITQELSGVASDVMAAARLQGCTHLWQGGSAVPVQE